LNTKTFTNPVTGAPMSVSEYVVQQTASNPSLPKTTGLPKTYSVAFSAKNNKKNQQLHFIPKGAGFTSYKIFKGVNGIKSYCNSFNPLTIQYNLRPTMIYLLFLFKNIIYFIYYILYI
jgi:hypothetical protein